MKKFAIFAFAACLGLVAKAENVLNVVPFAVQPNAGSVYVNIRLTNDIDVSSADFRLYLPDGIRVYTNASGNLISSSIAKITDRCDYSYYDEEEEDDVKVAAFGTISKNFQTDSEGKEFFIVAGGGDKNIQGHDGDLFKLRLNVGDIAPGVYPIYMRNVHINDATGTQVVTMPEVCSYVVVGDASAELALSGEVPTFVNEALVSETAISKLDLSEVTAINGDFAYVDGREVVGTEATAAVKYEGSNAKYYSVNVPFDGSVEGALYELKNVAGGYATFETVSAVVAGKTYLAKGDVTVSAASAAVAEVATKTGVEGSYVKDDKFYHGTNLIVKPMRGLFDVPAGSNLRIVVDGEITNITTAQIEAGEASYDLQGRQVQNAKNGVFVVNGKKQFVK